MGGDFCYHCDGTGERNWLSGAPCYECNGTGWKDELPEDDDWREGSCERCGCDLRAEDDGGLCDQCEWWLEQT